MLAKKLYAAAIVALLGFTAYQAYQAYRYAYLYEAAQARYVAALAREKSCKAASAAQEALCATLIGIDTSLRTTLEDVPDVTTLGPDGATEYTRRLFDAFTDALPAGAEPAAPGP